MMRGGAPRNLPLCCCIFSRRTLEEAIRARHADGRLVNVSPLEKAILRSGIRDPIGPMNPYATANIRGANQDRVNLRELLGILKHRRASILWTTLALVLFSLSYSLIIPPLYTASTRILIDPRDRQAALVVILTGVFLGVADFIAGKLVNAIL